MTLPTLRIPGMRLASESNAHTHWVHRQRRAQSQRVTAAMVAHGAWTKARTRLARMGALCPKPAYVIDGLADALGISNDRDPRLAWQVAQTRGPYAVVATIEASPMLFVGDLAEGRS